MMQDEKLQEMRRRQAEGMRAMSAEQMARLQFEWAEGARPRSPLTAEEQASMRNIWGTYPRIVSYLHIARDEAGNCIVYKGAGDFPGEGQTLKVKATIKEHTTYNGIPQTVIARPKVLETEAA